MAAASQHSRPALHNAMWPGLVGKGSPGAEPFIDLDTMLDMTAKAEVNGVKFDGVDLFLYNPHTDIDSNDDQIKQLADKVQSRGFVVGSVVAPVWFQAPMRNDIAPKRQPLSRRNALLSVVGYWLFVLPGLAWLVVAWRAGRLPF